MDATHVEAAVRAKSVPQILRELTKGMRKEIYKYEYDLSEKFPDKPSLEADVEEEIAYTRRLLENIREGVVRSENEKIKEMYRRIKELLDTDEIRQIRSKDDEDARFGHKTPTQQFFGYKTHIAMSEDRIITGLKVTDGAQPDGLQLPALIENSQKNGEMKTAHGFRRADSVGLIAMRLQAYLTAIVVNVKRIAAVMPA